MTKTAGSGDGFSSLEAVTMVTSTIGLKHALFDFICCVADHKVSKPMSTPSGLSWLSRTRARLNVKGGTDLHLVSSLW